MTDPWPTALGKGTLPRRPPPNTVYPDKYRVITRYLPEVMGGRFALITQTVPGCKPGFELASYSTGQAVYHASHPHDAQDAGITVVRLPEQSIDL